MAASKQAARNTVEVVEGHALVPQTFWARYIAKRKPVLIRGQITDLGWRANLWNDQYLKEKAGDAPVMVEVRNGPQGAFGKGVRRRMRFGEFVDAVARGDSSLYLSAQPVGVASDGYPELMAPPLTQLASDFELRPSLMGSLVPQQMNMWMGEAAEGSSTGLHHDFHDNLYLLLRGRKRFRLYPPADAPRMYLHGKLLKVHANGRFVYEGQGDVRADGTDAKDVARWRAKDDAERAVAEAEVAVARGEKGAKARLERAEALLDEVLDGELGGGSSDDFGGLDDFHDDFEDDNEDDLMTGSDDADQAAAGSNGPNGNAAKAGKAAASKAAAKGAKGAKGQAAGGDDGLEVDPDTPPSFSRVDMSLPDGQVAARWPRFPGKGAALEAVVEEGMMLYLPAGWFHEVTSFSGPHEPGRGGHMAFNYWFYPPNNLDPSPAGFEAPYTSPYLPALWAARLPAGHPEAQLAAEAAAAAAGRQAAALSPSPDAPGISGQQPQQASAAPASAPGAKRKRGDPTAPAQQQQQVTGATDDDLGAPAKLSAAMRQRLDLSSRAVQHLQQQQVTGADEADDLSPPRKLSAAMRRRLDLSGRATQQQQDEEATAEGSGAKGDAGSRALVPVSAAAGTGAGVAGPGSTQMVNVGGRLMTMEDFQALVAAVQRRAAAMGAMRRAFERQVKRDAHLRMLARLPRGRRHHLLVAVDERARQWRPSASPSPPPPCLPAQQQLQQANGKGKRVEGQAHVKAGGVTVAAAGKEDVGRQRRQPAAGSGKRRV